MSFHANVAQAALANTNFRKVLYTTERCQIVLMSVEVGDDIGLETHPLDQVLYFVAGTGEFVLGGHRGLIAPGDVVVVPAGTAHNFVNTGEEAIKLFTVYAPPEHAPGTVHRTHSEAEAAEAAEHAHAPVSMAVPAAPAPKRGPAGLTVGSLIGQR